MNTLVVFSALCAVAFGSAIHETPAVAAARAAHLAAHAAAAAGRVGVVGVHGIAPAHVGYAGAWAHGAAPLAANGVVVDTPEVAHAKAEHLAAVAQARSGAHGVNAWNAVPAVTAWNAAPAVAAWNTVPAVNTWNAVRSINAWNAAPAVWNGALVAAAHDNGQWNGDNGAVWVGNDNGQWHGEGVVDGAAYSGSAGAINVYAAGHGIHGLVKEGQWSPAIWGDKTAAANALGVGHLNGQWNAALWGDKAAHGHRYRRSAILAHGIVTPASTLPLAHTVAIAPAVSPLAHSIALAPAVSHISPLTAIHPVSTLSHSTVSVGHLGLGHNTLLL